MQGSEHRHHFDKHLLEFWAAFPRQAIHIGGIIGERNRVFALRPLSAKERTKPNGGPPAGKTQPFPVFDLSV
jgi:hypothetical protein